MVANICSEGGGGGCSKQVEDKTNYSTSAVFVHSLHPPCFAFSGLFFCSPVGLSGPMRPVFLFADHFWLVVLVSGLFQVCHLGFVASV